jgi:hypothetical protein
LAELLAGAVLALAPLPPDSLFDPPLGGMTAPLLVQQMTGWA